MRKYLRRPSPAMLVAIAALVWATCGSAIADGVNAVASALKPNSVTSKTIKNGSISLSDLSKSARKSLQGKTGPAGATGAKGDTGATGAQGPAGTPDGYTKTEADGAFLGKTAKAADADKLDGIDSASFVRGGGTQDDSFQVVTAGNSNTNFLDLPGIGKLEVSCLAGGVANATYRNTTSGTVSYTSTYAKDGAFPVVLQQSATAGNTFSIPGDSGNGYLETLQLHTGSFLSGSARVTVTLSGIKSGSDCRYQAQLLGSTSGGIIFVPLAKK